MKFSTLRSTLKKDERDTHDIPALCAPCNLNHGSHQSFRQINYCDNTYAITTHALRLTSSFAPHLSLI